MIWPEGAVPGFLLQESDSLDAISSYIGERKLIVGATRYEWFSEDTPVYYNSLAVLDASANNTGPIALYDKHRLVPFGELAAVDFIPFAASLPPCCADHAAPRRVRFPPRGRGDGPRHRADSALRSPDLL